jgi:hypothetical protein
MDLGSEILLWNMDVEDRRGKFIPSVPPDTRNFFTKVVWFLGMATANVQRQV